MKIYHVSAYYKQGDDLAAFLAKHKSPCKALEKWGQHIIKIGQQVITLASFLESKSGVFGKIEFLADSTHNLAGQTVDLPEWTKDEYLYFK